MAEKKRRLPSLLEFPLTIGSGLLAEPAAGIAGLYGLMTGGADEGVRRIDDVRQKMTYEPQNAGTKESLRRLGLLTAPIEKGLNYARTGLGDMAYNATGSPAAATAAHMVPDTLLSFLGGRAALRQAPAVQSRLERMVQQSAGPTYGSPMAARGSIGVPQSGMARQYPMAPRSEWYGEGTYEADGGRIVQMTPEEYLAQVKHLEIDEISRENIDDLKRHIEEGRTLDPLLIRANGKEDGRHRANAALELGISHIPVIDYRKPK